MIRSEIIESIDRLRKAIDESNLDKIFRHMINEGGAADPGMISEALEAYREYSRLSDSFDRGTRRLVEILYLGILEKSDFWTELIYG